MTKNKNISKLLTIQVQEALDDILTPVRVMALSYPTIQGDKSKGNSSLHFGAMGPYQTE